VRATGGCGGTRSPPAPRAKRWTIRLLMKPPPGRWSGSQRDLGPEPSADGYPDSTRTTATVRSCRSTTPPLQHAIES
jgi:hypothetical protein